MAISWLEKTFNDTRSEENHLAYVEKTGNVPSHSESNDVWHNWDFKVKTGAYRFQFLSHQAYHVTYFTIGTVPYPNQIVPMRPEDRFGFGILATLNEAHHNKVISTPINFNIQKDQVLRIESWIAKEGPLNPSPLPMGFSKWRGFTPHKIEYKLVKSHHEDSYVKIAVPGELVDLDNFGNNFKCVSRRKNTDNSIVFYAEDGLDDDFNDLVVELVRISK